MSLLSFLKENPDSRKVFGERELKIIEKQLMGVPLTQSEKNRLSRDIRKKLEFIKGLSRFEKDFRLKKGAMIKKAIEKAKDIILETDFKGRIKKIILFGSNVKNKLNLMSDIDIAVEFGEINLKEATLFRKHVSGRVDSKIDIQVFEFLPENIRKDIKREGTVIYEHENTGQDKRD
ncbi:MAG: nucleotidyltransferase domain-containing protein [Candidatus Woesearchaeota archaeon]|nr:nucleotidyltransferase domain-containing protein [Candidatus Woesearchaeota archaeon]